MLTRQPLTRILATLIFFLTKKKIMASEVRFLVFTGTVGKTTTKDAVAYTLKNLNIPVRTNALGYSNELGILLTIFDYPDFSLKNPLTWVRLLRQEIPKNCYICVELGADFYQDIRWFLKKFTPFAIFISGIADISWSRIIEEVYNDRKKLLEAIPSFGYLFYNNDDTATTKLLQRSSLVCKTVSFGLNKEKNADTLVVSWSKNIYSMPTKDASNKEDIVTITTGGVVTTIRFTRVVFEPQLYSVLAAVSCVNKLFPEKTFLLPNILKKYEFSQNRLQIHEAKNGALIIEDIYKATPLCTEWFLAMSSKIVATRKILVITEMRPLTTSVNTWYKHISDATTFVDEVYYIGPEKTFTMINNRRTNYFHVTDKNYNNLASTVLEHSQHGDVILLKGSYRYKLEMLRESLK